MIFLIERGNRYRDALAAGLLCVSVTSHPTGLAFVTAGAVMVAMRPSPKRWTSSWIVILPACLFGIWYLFFRVDLGRGPTDIFDVISFSFSSWTMLIAALSGLSKPLSDPVYEQPLAQIGGWLVLLIIIAITAFRFRALKPTYWAAAAGLCFLFAEPRLGPEGFFRSPDTSRYFYPQAVLFLLMLVSWLRHGGARNGLG